MEKEGIRDCKICEVLKYLYFAEYILLCMFFFLSF